MTSDIAEVMDELPADFEFYKVDASPVSPGLPRLSARAVHVAEGIDAASAAPVEGKRSGYGDRVVFIFTSGTTGLPKAVPLKNSRYLLMGGGLDMCGLSRGDVVYTTLPLYHTAANGLVMGGSICNGAYSALLRPANHDTLNINLLYYERFESFFQA